MFSRTLVAGLNDLGERSWAELKKAKAVDTLWLAKILHPYDIRSRTIWIGDMHAKGYLKKYLEVLFHRYIRIFPRSEIDALLAECAREKSEASEQKKDEPGEAQGGEAEAA